MENSGQHCDLQFTGERFIASIEPEDSHLAIEHAARYNFALDFVKATDDVLDCASGSGYGSATLAARARAVTGVDISAEAIAHSSGTYRAANLRYVVGDATRLAEFADESFSLITSFETIEHIEDQHAYAQNMRRLLRKDGTLIVSTPNSRFYETAQLPEGPVNPFHVHELTIDELRNLLESQFSEVSLFGQSYYNPPQSHRLLQSLLLLANRSALYRRLREMAPTKLKNRVVESIGSAPSRHILPLSDDLGVPRNIVAVCRR